MSTSLAHRPMSVVFGLGTKLRVRMRATLENGVLRNDQSGSASLVPTPREIEWGLGTRLGKCPEEVVQVYGICIRALHFPVISVMIIGVMRLSYNDH